MSEPGPCGLAICFKTKVVFDHAAANPFLRPFRPKLRPCRPFLLATKTVSRGNVAAAPLPAAAQSAEGDSINVLLRISVLTPWVSRLKLRCDRQVPCSSCVKRGCGAICPDGAFKHLLVLLPANCISVRGFTQYWLMKWLIPSSASFLPPPKSYTTKSRHFAIAFAL
jgi:hypothetical protein